MLNVRHVEKTTDNIYLKVKFLAKRLLFDSHDNRQADTPKTLERL